MMWNVVILLIKDGQVISSLSLPSVFQLEILMVVWSCEHISFAVAIDGTGEGVCD